ncbi:IMPACT family protein [Sinomicrobium sp. M5D2P9]
MTEKDTYKTITGPSPEVLFKDKNSKFFGYAYPVHTEEKAKEYIDLLRKKHHAARHWCYAWQLGTENVQFRANDDGEPNNSAGMPIYGQVQSFEVTNILIVVVRYFGGVKLGVGGLIHAYRTAAQMALEASDIKERTIDIFYLLTFDYKDMNKVMRVIKEKNLTIANQKLELDCRITISVRKRDAGMVADIFGQIYGVEITRIDD